MENITTADVTVIETNENNEGECKCMKIGQSYNDGKCTNCGKQGPSYVGKGFITLS